MNRKLHNTASALIATSALLVLSLIAAGPLPQHAIESAPAFAQAQAAHNDAAHRVDARAKLLETRLRRTSDNAEAAAQVAAFVAETATAAVIDEALSQAVAPANASEAAPLPATPHKPHRSRQSVAMPFFSFAPRG
jgi:hypothetical protein